MSTDSKKRLALAIINFLQTSITDGTVAADEKDSIEAAEELIAGAFGVNSNDKKAMQDALGGQSLLKIYEVFEKMKGTRAPSAASVSTSTPAASTSAAPSDADKASAEALKAKGNSSMAARDYTSAIDLYTQALKIVPANPIYLSNRAAAYSASQLHDKAKLDAQAAVESDPTYSKGWSRLGLAKFALGDAKGSMEAYEMGIQAEGKGGSEAMRKGFETAKRRVEEDESVSQPPEEPLSRDASPFGGAGGAGGMPDLSSLAGMFGGAGGGGGGGPDLSSIMSNPMFSQMAQNLMSNPQLMGSLMNNPKLKDMMNGAGGGGMPDMGSLMNDPDIAEMAKNLMGGASGPSAPK